MSNIRRHSKLLGQQIVEINCADEADIQGYDMTLRTFINALTKLPDQLFDKTWLDVAEMLCDPEKLIDFVEEQEMTDEQRAEFFTQMDKFAEALGVS